MSEIPDIDPGDGEIGDIPAPDGAIEAAIATGAALACLSCAAKVTGPYCSNCGQRNDDMRRSSIVLARDFLKDTFAFDSRMWRTLGLLAAAPGRVPADYSHGKRSRYTPPVRIFLFVSFLFFLVLGLTHTMFVAVEVTSKTPEQIAREKADYEAVLEKADPETRALLEEKLSDEERAIIVDGEDIDCAINVGMRFFVRSKDVRFEEEKWRACADSFSKAATDKIDEENVAAVDAPTKDSAARRESFRVGFDRIVTGVNQMVSNPTAFNAGINTWLPRVMFLMTPILALILTLFLRGKDALMFDHLVLSLYSHAAGFAVIGSTIVLAQFGAPNMFPAALILLTLYFVIALKRAYGRSWRKTIYTALFSGFLYLLVLVSVVGAIISNQIWSAAA